jgi:glycosyltransferase involved in cell wall biosynthesis
VDLLVLPSYNEGLPYVVIEAMASGLSVIASSVGGIPEAIRHGENGYIIEPGDSQSLARYILSLAADREFREAMGEHNRQRAVEHYSSDVALGQLERAFDEVMTG